MYMTILVKLFLSFKPNNSQKYGTKKMSATLCTESAMRSKIKTNMYDALPRCLNRNEYANSTMAIMSSFLICITSIGKMETAYKSMGIAGRFEN
ncbi:hypothetical protein X281_09075 [Oenococcus oeni IOEB_0607]|nr:hypothetical protein X281_09075 [Oenococcus oeni IOEB_0607]